MCKCKERGERGDVVFCKPTKCGKFKCFPVEEQKKHDHCGCKKRDHHKDKKKREIKIFIDCD